VLAFDLGEQMSQWDNTLEEMLDNVQRKVGLENVSHAQVCLLENLSYLVSSRTEKVK